MLIWGVAYLWSMKVGRNLLITVFLNILITLVELIGGIFSGSLALVSDALHNFSDALSGTASYAALKISGREHTPKMTFGYKRAQILVALFNSLLLIAIMIFLFREAYEKIVHPSAIEGNLMSMIAFVGLISNTFSTLLLKKGARESLNIRSAYLHLFTDALSSLAIVIGGIIIILFHFYLIDAILTIIIGAYIIKKSYNIIKKAVDILMEAAPPYINLEEIKKEIEGLSEVANLHHVHVWQMDEKNINFEGHVKLCRDIKISEADKLMEEIKKILRRFGITHATIQMEYNACKDKKLIK